MVYSSAEWPTRSLLGVVAPEARGELLELGVPARFEAGKVLLTEGARTRHMLVLLSGFAKVTARVENGEESLLAVRVGGDSVGEMAALDGSPRSATVTACGPLSAMVVQPAALHALLARRPEVHLALTRILADRLRWANRRRLDFKGYPAKVRLARLLVELATRYGRPVGDGTVLGCRLTQPELAALTGAAETTIHKGLRELRREGLLETGYGSTLIRDLDRLREIGDLAPED
ncbi:transcriptional regulator [Streptomyces viridochromogenes DSM 40736]|uniref:Transcriptional regulator n=1 Tax=Streptomyces viridochromogenes (strain DSM 40736 / JCM 4977 / BCRC 1201 / Tue 494) TaxID=591159 RepID=D9XH47_STRVT|nr:Crp/Fnr family transcriptional regulator [Streptomyces viridochromogenes]EFL32840.1 transcriptional regulator [Streptomyces viridochromogenes DSM 40736]